MPSLVGAEADRLYLLALPDTISFVDYPGGGTPDRYGNPTPGTPSSSSVPALIEPLDATEDEIGRDTRVSRFKVSVKPGVTIAAEDTITWEGRSLEVVGDPLHDSVEGLRLLTFTAKQISG